MLIVLKLVLICTCVISYQLSFRSSKCVRGNTYLFQKFGSLETEANNIKSKGISSYEVVEKALSRIFKIDGDVQGFLSVYGEAALNQAKEIDKKTSEQVNLSKYPLYGIPIAVKDNICVKDTRTTCASKILEGYIPTYDATVVRKLKEAGAIIIGKTNMDEFAMGSTTESSAYQITRNPWNSLHSPGGSSGGSAAVIASNQVLAALGSDTGGSVRQPAAWCGAVGMKPTYGRLSRSGLVAYASSTDCVGPITSSVRDAALMLTVLAGGDDKDYTTSQRPESEVQSFLAACGPLNDKPLLGMRIGVITETMMTSSEGGRSSEDVKNAIQQSISNLEYLGAVVRQVSFPRLSQQCAAYYVYVTSEASANLARFDGIRYGLRLSDCDSSKQTMLKTRQLGFGPEVRKRILLGTFALSSGYQDEYYNKATEIVRQLSESLDLQLGPGDNQFDLLLCPTAPGTAYKIGDTSKSGEEGYADDLYTVPASLAGLPAISIPCGLSKEGLPIGLQLIGPKWSESQIFQAAYAFEQYTLQDSWRSKRPQIYAE